jgi:hypothetical protein
MQQSQHLYTLKTTDEAGGAHSVKASGALNFKHLRVLNDPWRGIEMRKG